MRTKNKAQHFTMVYNFIGFSLYTEGAKKRGSILLPIILLVYNYILYSLSPWRPSTPCGSI